VIEHLAAFLAVSVLVIVTPGQDTALTIRNTLLGGRGGGVSTALGVSTGQAVWALATSAGLSALLAASHPLFVALRIAGAAYLVYLGAQALHDAVRRRGPAEVALLTGPGRPAPPRAFRQGLLSNLGNPKMVVFFTSLLPQFVAPGRGGFPALLLLGLLFCSMTFTWLALYAVAVARVRAWLLRSQVRRVLDAITGTVLVALGLRLGTSAGRSALP
jgi:RhtB (resistance to homoserine/threonine) family protein